MNEMPKMGSGIATILLFLVLVTASHAQTTPPDGQLLGERAYSFPSYENAYGYTRFNGTQDDIGKYWSKTEYENAITDDRFEFQKLLYASDGLSVVAYVYKPVVDDGALPVIVFNRGSGVHKDIAPVLVPYFHRLAQEGFVVIAPMYRQTDGGEGIDANGGDDLNDLLNTLPLIKALPYADADNIYMTGESRGAMMVYQAIRDGFPMRAAAVWGGFTDLQPLIDEQPMLAEYAKQTWPGFATNLEGQIRRRSAIFWAESFTTPILLMHGESDGSIPVAHTYNLAMKLQELGRLYGLVVFADDNHILSRSQVERDRESVRWFRNFSTEAENRRLDFLRTAASERDITDVGYSLLRRGQNDEAIAVFRIGTDRYPDAVNTHDSLGEALAATGKTEEAIASYSRALQLTDDATDRERIHDIIRNIEAAR